MNILFLLPDQLRPDFLSCYGAQFMNTPNIDALCDGSVQYRHTVSPTPICVPARASLLTGLNSVQHGVLENYSLAAARSRRVRYAKLARTAQRRGLSHGQHR